MANDAQRLADAEEHRRSYNAIMKVSGQVGVPLALALAVFFTNLVMANGLISVVAGVITYVFVYFVVRTFFSH